MFRRCRLCKKQAVDGSMFCSDHRQQAAAFAASFGPQDSQSAAGATPEPSPAISGEQTRLDALMQSAVESISEWSARQRRQGITRRPQISIYFLNDAWHARSYFSIVPPEASAQEADLETFDWARARQALSPGQPVYEEIARQLEAHRDDLKEQRVQKLDIHFLGYAGLILINAHAQGQPDANLATFVLAGERFDKTEPGEVEPRLGDGGRPVRS